LPLPTPAPALASGLVPERLVAQGPAQESYAAELALLRRAQSAYAGGDFSGALLKLGEHAKRFPNGRLTEEREALRVRSLVSAGRTSLARSAFAAFARRFPRSVLLPRLRQAVGVTEAE
jgi:TolA-binding protein